MATKTLPALLDEASYPHPDTVYEYYDEIIPIRSVNRHDQINSGTSNPVVWDTKTGTKWTELFRKDGTRIMRELNDTEVTVTRRRETRESREATRRVDRNRAILRDLEPDLGHEDDDGYWARKIGEALDKAKATTDQGWILRSGDVADIVITQARVKIRAQWVQSVEWAASGRKHVNSYDDNSPLWVGDLVDVLEEFLATLPAVMVQMQSSFPLSRSTSVMENVMRDAEVWAVAEFIDQAKWWH